MVPRLATQRRACSFGNPGAGTTPTSLRSCYTQDYCLGSKQHFQSALNLSSANISAKRGTMQRGREQRLDATSEPRLVRPEESGEYL